MKLVSVVDIFPKSCIDVFFEDIVVMEEEFDGLRLGLLGKESERRDGSGSCVGGESNILPITVISVVGVVGVGDLKSKAKFDSVESERG